jgi:hypothetical protein
VQTYAQEVTDWRQLYPHRIRSPGSCKLKGERDWYTHVGHSAGNWFSSIDRSNFGFAENSYRVNVNNVTAIGGGVTNAATNFAGTAGVVAGSIAIGMSATAATAVAGACASLSPG